MIVLLVPFVSLCVCVSACFPCARICLCESHTLGRWIGTWGILSNATESFINQETKKFHQFSWWHKTTLIRLYKDVGAVVPTLIHYIVFLLLISHEGIERGTPRGTGVKTPDRDLLGTGDLCCFCLYLISCRLSTVRLKIPKKHLSKASFLGIKFHSCLVYLDHVYLLVLFTLIPISVL